MKLLPLDAHHESLGAKFGEFAGYRMPLYYGKPIDEHHQVRKAAGIFDISHMGQFRVTGPQAEAMLAYTLPNAVAAMQEGDALYSPMCREDGGVLDDLIIYRYGPERYRVIVNGATKDKDLEWMQGVAERFEAEVEDMSDGLCLLAVQGPQTFDKLRPHAATPPDTLKYYSFTETKLFGTPVFLARTGYTGEPGCEMAVAREHAGALWDKLTGELGIAPIGLAARDTLRLEAAMPLYGHELSEDWHPLECGLGWAVKLNREDDFIGKKALQAVKATNHAYRAVGLEITGRGIAREHYPVLKNGEPVGGVTSGALSPTLGKAIALARVRSEVAKVETPLQVEVRGRPVEAVVVRRPFYKNDALKA